MEVKGDAAIATLGQQSERPRTAWTLARGQPTKTDCLNEG